MTLLELSASYASSAALLRARMAALRAAEKEAPDAETAFALRRRMAELTPLLREMRELAELTAHYYDRSFHRYERYTL